jgi:alpha-glucosidase
VLDLVLNHTSHLHSWFLESKSSRDNPKRDWYIWRSGRDGGPPNNWVSSFGGAGWEYDAATEQYYYHYFFKEQPDLNWRNPEVKQAMFEAVRFWLDMGVDGFRLDAIGTIYEDPAMPDHTAELTLHELQSRGREAKTPEEHAYLHKQWVALMGAQVDLPEVHDLMKDLRQVIDEYDDRVLIGETDDIQFHGSGDDELHMVFNFPMMRTDKLTPEHIRVNQTLRLEALPEGAWPCNTLGNHDSPRVLTRFGDGEHDEALARLSLALMLTLRGTPFLYNGEEIGMSDFYLSDISEFRDFIGTWLYAAELEDGTPQATAFEHAVKYTRDKCRTPMQWAAAANGGFSPAGVQPWLPVNPNWEQGVNVESQLNDPASMLAFYRRLIAIRQATPALVGGDYKEVKTAEAVLAFTRGLPEQTCFVALNYSAEAQAVEVPGKAKRVVYSSTGRIEAGESMRLEPFEILIVELTK